MSKLWYVTRYEYLRHVLRKGFLFAILSVPFWILVTILVVGLLVLLETDDKPVGYVDTSGFLSNPIELPEPPFPEVLVPLFAFDSEQQAKQELEASNIQAYYVLSPDYPQSKDVKLVYVEQPSSSATSQFRDFLRINLLAQQNPDVARRVIQGADLRVVTLGDESQAQGFGLFLKLLIPAFAGLAMMVAVFTSSGYLMQAVVDEKENRTMEIMITSLSPAQMMAGKIIGLIGVGLTQIFVWLLMGLFGLLFFAGNLDYVSGFSLNLENFWLAIAVIIPAFVMISALMAAIGATVTESREGSQVTGLITLPVMLPFILFGVLINNPSGPLAVVMSIFPLTAPMTIIIRSAFTTIPIWQVGLSITLLIISAIGALWLAGQVFRLGMLRYGKKVSLKEVVGLLKPRKLAGQDN